MKRCGKDCSACPYIREVKSLNINTNEWKINQNFNCEISNCIYLIECMKEHCNMKYVGETKRILKFRLLWAHSGHKYDLDMLKFPVSIAHVMSMSGFWYFYS
jgi:hypothetical protein